MGGGGGLFKNDGQIVVTVSIRQMFLLTSLLPLVHLVTSHSIFYPHFLLLRHFSLTGCVAAFPPEQTPASMISHFPQSSLWSCQVQEGHWGGEELQSYACSGLSSVGMGDLLGRGAPRWRRTLECGDEVLVFFQHQLKERNSKLFFCFSHSYGFAPQLSAKE